MRNKYCHLHKWTFMVKIKRAPPQLRVSPPVLLAQMSANNNRLANATLVATIASVNLDSLALVNKQRNAYCSTSLNCSGLE